MKLEAKNSEYNNSIQGLRGLAILLIIISHIYGRYSMLGGLGAAIFAAISGYLAASQSKDNNKTLNLKQKVYRIGKLYLLYFLVTCITAIYFNPEIVYGVSRKEGIAAFICNIFMIQTYVPKSSFFGAFSQVGWYMPFVALCILLYNQISVLWRKTGIKEGILIIATYLAIYIAIILSGYDKVYWITYVFPFFRLIEYIIGGYIFIFVDKINSSDNIRNEKWLYALILVVVVAIMGCISLANIQENKLYLRIVWWYIPTWCILFAINYVRYIKRILECSLLVYIGNISFELFLIHLMVKKGVEFILSGGTIPLAVVNIITFILMIILAIVVNKLDRIWKNKLYEILFQREGAKK